jgi:hypothetical protein
MNQKIKRYFEVIELKLLDSEVVESFEIIRQDISDIDGKIRIRLQLVNRDMVDLFEYIIVENDKIHIKKYHHHWQSSENVLICRWDNAPHHKELDHFPNHMHKDEKVESIVKIPDIKYIIKTIERFFKNKIEQ